MPVIYDDPDEWEEDNDDWGEEWYSDEEWYDEDWYPPLDDEDEW